MKNESVDFGKTADDYGKHRRGFPTVFFQQMKLRGLLEPGLRVLDLGTGTGFVAREFAKHGCVVDALDIAPEMLELARELDRKNEVEIAYHLSPAEETPFENETFDIVMAGQCWRWFDPEIISTEVMRILKPGSSLVTAHHDWLPHPGSVPEATEAFILKHNPAWTLGGRNGLYPERFAELMDAGFTMLESFTMDVEEIYSHEDWRGRIRASAGISASLSQEKVCLFDEEHGEMLTERFPDDPLAILHRLFVLIGQKVSSKI